MKWIRIKYPTYLTCSRKICPRHECVSYAACSQFIYTFFSHSQHNPTNNIRLCLLSSNKFKIFIITHNLREYLFSFFLFFYFIYFLFIFLYTFSIYFAIFFCSFVYLSIGYVNPRQIWQSWNSNESKRVAKEQVQTLSKDAQLTYRLMKRRSSHEK